MKKLWKFANGRPWAAEKKYGLCVWALAVLGAVAGALLWLLVSRVALGTPDWLIVFTGTPVLCAPIAVFLYGCRHPF